MGLSKAETFERDDADGRRREKDDYGEQDG